MPPPPEHLVNETALYTLWREPHVMYLKMRGDVTDVESVIWRGVVDEHTATVGWPSYMVIDIVDALSVGTMAGRVRTAAWARGTLKRLCEGAIYTGSNQTTHFVTRALLRVIGMPNVEVIGDAATLEATYARYRAGPPAQAAHA